MWPRCESRSRRAAWYSMARFFRPSKVPRERHLRSRSRTLRTACRQSEQQYRAGLRMECTGDSWQPGRSHNGGEKRVCCVTTRQRNRWVVNGLRRQLGTLAARFLCLGMPGFNGRILTMSGLPPRGLPAADLPQAFRILAVTLVPSARLINPPAPLAQAEARAWPAPSGQTAVRSLNVVGAHGRCFLPRESSGRMRQHSPRALSNTNQKRARQSTAFDRNKTENETALEMRHGRRRKDPRPLH
jgi:hypothetical protein